MSSSACLFVAATSLGRGSEPISHPDQLGFSVVPALAFPKRFASFLLRLFSSNSNVLELAIIHLQQLLPLAVAEASAIS